MRRPDLPFLAGSVAPRNRRMPGCRCWPGLCQTPLPTGCESGPSCVAGGLKALPSGGFDGFGIRHAGRNRSSCCSVDRRTALPRREMRKAASPPSRAADQELMRAVSIKAAGPLGPSTPGRHSCRGSEHAHTEQSRHRIVDRALTAADRPRPGSCRSARAQGS